MWRRMEPYHQVNVSGDVLSNEQIFFGQQQQLMWPKNKSDLYFYIAQV